MHTEHRVDPFRTAQSAPSPTITGVARGVLHHLPLMREILRLLAWTDLEQVEDIRAACDAAIAHREDVLRRCRAGTFARYHYGLPIDGSEEIAP